MITSGSPTKHPTIMNRLIVLPFALPFAWGADYERITATILSEDNVVLCFLVGEGYTFRSLLQEHKYGFLLTHNHSLYIFRPLYVFPFQRIRFIAEINFFFAAMQTRAVCVYLRQKYRIRQRTVLWMFSLQTAVIPQWFSKRWIKVYDCLDAFISEVPSLRRLWQRREQLILRGSRYVFTNTTTLFHRLKHLHPSVYHTPAGFDLDTYRMGNGIRRVPRDIISIPGPRIGFIGNISERIDVTLMQKVIQLLPHYAFIFIGPIDNDYRHQIANTKTPSIHTLTNLPNVFMLGNKPRKLLPSYMRTFSAGITPYNVRHIFNHFSFPVKTHEYFYMGVPVVATPIPELKRLVPLIKIAATPKAFAAAIRECVRATWPRSYRQKQRTLAVSNSWRAKIAYMMSVINHDRIAG